ncbi:MBL fold metallo-hydrolase [Natrialbaceae archaeon A-CW1-1]
MENVERIEIPTPFQIGRVNCYAIAEADVTVVDPGPFTDEAYKTLEAGLARISCEPSDIDRILITHPHIDHFGLANRLAQESGATVYAHEDAVDVLDNPTGNFEQEQTFFSTYLSAMGVPEQLLETIISLPESYNRFREPVAVDEALVDDDTIALEGEDILEVLHTPGHAPSSICFLDREADSAFTGDHIMADISPNPLLTLEPGTTDKRTRSLPTYLEALERIANEDVTTGYGGHRPTVPDISARVEEIVAHHRKRDERVIEVIDEHGSMTAYELMTHLFPDLPATEAFAGLSEAIGHLDVLEDASRVQQDESGNLVQYELT